MSSGLPSRTVALHDGSRVRLRQLDRQDRGLLERGFERLSERSRYQRFFAPVPRLTPAQLTYLTDIDHRDHEAIIAIEPSGGDPLGVARYVRSSAEPEVAEAAIAVIDEWQGRGLGRALLSALADRARAQGVRYFSGLVQAENQRSIQLVSGLGDAVRSQEGPYVELRIELPDRGVGARMGSALRAAAAGSLVLAGNLAHRTTTPMQRSAGAVLPPVQPGGGLKRIVLGIDASPTAQRAARLATELAKRLGGDLHVVSAYNPNASGIARRARPSVPDGLSWLDWVVTGREDADAVLRRATDTASSAGVEATAHPVADDPAEALIKVAVERDADLIVVGSKGMTGSRRFLLGSVGAKVAHHAPCSVLIARTV